ncbi:MAG TPA: CpsD/CapB family tyrosine-protein kinase [Vicinamibacterales bacterium]|nr:CpsD/CapB family tyrosine-protein kinase [Vicinamibacterales bacterium]
MFESKPVQELVSFVAPSSLEADQYRMLRHAVERLHDEAGYQVFGVTSAGAGDGKTVTTLNLAGSLAQSPTTRVLVVCADLHRETATEYLGLPSQELPGLAEALADARYDLAQVVTRIDELNISILPAGNAQTRPYELLASPRLEMLLDEARRQFDYVLVDTPPIAPLADSRLLGRWVDGFILVVAANKTPRKLLAEALSVLQSARVFGVVFNGDEQPLSPYYGYYTHYHKTPARSSGWRSHER